MCSLLLSCNKIYFVSKARTLFAYIFKIAFVHILFVDVIFLKLHRETFARIAHAFSFRKIQQGNCKDFIVMFTVFTRIRCENRCFDNNCTLLSKTKMCICSFWTQNQKKCTLAMLKICANKVCAFETKVIINIYSCYIIISCDYCCFDGNTMLIWTVWIRLAKLHNIQNSFSA